MTSAPARRSEDRSVGATRSGPARHCAKRLSIVRRPFWLMVSVAERGRAVVGDPFPHRYGATEFGVGDEVAFVELLGVGADRTDQETTTGRLVALHQIR